MNPASTVTSSDGTEIAFYRSGTGPALILVDAAMCFHDFGPAPALAQALSPYFTVYTYDRRGRGNSGDTTPYAIGREVEDIGALINAAGGSAGVYGISSGAGLALHAAASGLPISKLGLFEPPFTAEIDGDPDAVNAEHARMDEMIAANRRGDVVETFMSYVMPPEVVEGMKNSPEWAALESLAHTAAYDNVIMGDGTVPRDVAAEVSVPTIVVDGGESPDILRKAAKAVADATPGASYHTVDGLSHTSDPGTCVPVLREFFSGH